MVIKYVMVMSNDVDLSSFLKTKLEPSEDFSVSRETLIKKGEIGPEYGDDIFGKYLNSWRDRVGKQVSSDDSGQILSSAVGCLQANLLALAFNGEKESTKLAATTYALEQAGVGAIKNTHIHNTYDSVPTEQLVAMFQERAGRLEAAGLSITNLLDAKTNSGKIIDAEIINVSTDEEIISDR